MMTYQGYMTDKIKKNQRLNRYFIVNATFAILVVLTFMEDRVERSLFFAIMGILGLIFTPLIRKSIKTNRYKRKSMVEEHGDEVILARGEDYFGFVSTEKIGPAVLLLFYLIVLLFCITMVYDVLEMPVFAIIIVDVLHVLLLSPIFFTLKKGLLQTVLFTSSKVIIRDAVVIDIDSQFKHQFFELIDGRYILEINSGERFQRFCLEAEAHSKIVSLI